MGFDALLGNDQLKENLRCSVSQGKLSHFYLISGPKGAGKHTLAHLLGAAMVCTAQDKPCCVCPACRKVLSDTHPDFITIDEPEKKTVSVELVRNAREDIYIRPNEANKKIYLFPRAQDMTLPAQNALLKILEEPPAYGVFLLLTDNAEKLLPTVLSRCVTLSVRALPENLLRTQLQKTFPDADPEQLSSAIARSGGYLGQANQLLAGNIADSPQTAAFAEAYAGADRNALLRILIGLERTKRDALISILEDWLSLLQNALISRSGICAISPASRKISSARSSLELLTAISCLQKAIEYAQGNVSPAAICGYLVWALQ